MTTENYVYKKEVDWSLLTEGVTVPLENQVMFGKIMGIFLKRGESKNIVLYLDGKSYPARITNVNFSAKFNRKKDTFQIRYSKNGEFAQVLQAYFRKSYQYICSVRAAREPGDRKIIRVPDEFKEYLAIYTTEYDDTYVVEPIIANDIELLKELVKGKSERTLEQEMNYDIEDISAGILETERMLKIRKLNRKIGDNLKLLYGYRCQICGKIIGAEFDSNIVEAHHIDYFVSSLNNDANNQLIVCPNHHSIIHATNPVFDRKKLSYIYNNGIEQHIMINLHLR